MRLAFVSPLPPAPTGIADYTMDVVSALGGSHDIELFHDQSEVSSSLGAPAFPVADLPARHASAPYDAVTYQMGNAPAHDFMYGWMDRVPGAVVLHDLVLHHSFARRYLESPVALAYASDPASREKQAQAHREHRAYVEAIDAVYPGQGERLKDAHFNTSGDLLPYAFPLFEPAIASAKAVGAHNTFMVEAIESARPGLRCVPLAMPVEPVPLKAGAVEAMRAKFGLAHVPVVGCFGLLTREKRIETVARALARVAEIHPTVRLLLVGQVSEETWLKELLDRVGVADRTVIAGRVGNEEFAAAMEIADVVVHLRYPTARETSAALLRVMAQGRPMIISAIANQSEIPEDAARRIDPIDEEGDLSRALEGMLRDPRAARAMGERGRAFVRNAHSAARTRETYEQFLMPLAPHYSPSTS